MNTCTVEICKINKEEYLKNRAGVVHLQALGPRREPNPSMKDHL